MFLETDTHCHTVASTHAYCTILELAHEAARKGLKAIAITDHGPKIPDGAHPWHFGNLRCLPPFIEGVRILHGAEANIIDFEGSIDIEPAYQRELDWVIASFHAPACAPGTKAQHTQAYLKLAENPHIDVIGHCGSDEFAFDYEKVLPVLRDNHILVEINNHSFEARAGARKNCLEIARLCKRMNVPVVLNSDAHSIFSLGETSEAVRLLTDIGFPEELVINLTYQRLARWIFERRGRDIGLPH